MAMVRTVRTRLASSCQVCTESGTTMRRSGKTGSEMGAHQQSMPHSASRRVTQAPIAIVAFTAILLGAVTTPVWSADAAAGRNSAQRSSSESSDVLQPVSTLGEGNATGGQSRASAANSVAATAMSRVAGRYRSIARNEAVLYDAPSDRSTPLFVAPAGMPVEVVSVQRDWMKVRDVQGDLAWVARGDVSDQRTLVVQNRTSLYRDPRPGSSTWFDLAPGVLIQPLAETPDAGFLRVRCADGTTGWVLATDVWGG